MSSAFFWYQGGAEEQQLSGANIDSPSASISMSSFSPSIVAGKNIFSPSASLQLSGAVSKQFVEVFPSAVQLKLSGFTPALVVDVPVNLLSMRGVLQTPTASTVASGIVTAVDILPPGGAFTLISLDPSIAAGKNIQSPLSSIILSGFSPDIVAGKNIQPPQGDLILEALVPNIVAGKNILSPSGTITMSLIAPDIAAGKNIQPPGLTMIMDGLSPSVLNGVAIDADTGIWTMEAFAPVIGGALHISVDEFFMIMEGLAATVPGVGITRGRSGSVNLREGVSQTRGATFAEIIDGVGIEKVELE